MTKIKDLLSKYGNREVDEVELKKILKPVEKSIYDLESWDNYYLITPNGAIQECTWRDDDLNNSILSIGNVFLTYEEAECQVEYLKVKAELKRYSSMCEEPIDWKNQFQCKFYCGAAFGMIHFLSTTSTKGDNIYFTDKSVLEKALKEIGEERIIKYYLNMN